MPVTIHNISISETTYTQIIDEADSNTIFQCWAVAGTPSSAAKWRIRKIITSGNITTIKWADGNTKFDNIADNRANDEIEYS